MHNSACLRAAHSSISFLWCLQKLGVHSSSMQDCQASESISHKSLSYVSSPAYMASWRCWLPRQVRAMLILLCFRGKYSTKLSIKPFQERWCKTSVRRIELHSSVQKCAPESMFGLTMVICYFDFQWTKDIILADSSCIEKGSGGLQA